MSWINDAKGKRGCPFVESYVIIQLLPFPLNFIEMGGEYMSLASFLVSVAAGVIANYICKWLDGCGKSSKH